MMSYSNLSLSLSLSLFLLILPFLSSFTSASPTAINANPVILIFACDRASQLRQALRSVAAATSTLPSASFSVPPVIVSIDDTPRFSRVEQAAKRDNIPTHIWHHRNHLHNESQIDLHPSSSSSSSSSQPTPVVIDVRTKISLHYRDTLSRLFRTNASVTHAIILEDDLRISPDAFHFLLSVVPYLSLSSGVVTASLWNDNLRTLQPGHASLTSFFPGLGWICSRELWLELSQSWPPSKHAIVGTGWDFWMRVQFSLRNWYIIVPTTPRVRHVGTASANVAPQQQAAQYARAHYATEKSSHFDWHHFFTANGKHLLHPDKFKDYIISTIQESKQQKKTNVMPFKRTQFRTIVKQFQLWPTPRGFFHHVLLVLINASVVVLYDEIRAPLKFPSHLFPSISTTTTTTISSSSSSSLSSSSSSSSLSTSATIVKYIVANRNQSCAQACASKQLGICSIDGIDMLNDCARMRKLFEDQADRGCEKCAYETGRDLPARVEYGAPLHTEGHCLITEDVSHYDCHGSFAWTRRACACESTVFSTPPPPPSSSSSLPPTTRRAAPTVLEPTPIVHDEL